jgi:hypothetical protein
MIQLTNKYIAIEIPTAVSVEGYRYDSLYTVGGEYEFHSLPYNEMPPIRTGVKTSEYRFVAISNAMTEELAAQIVETFNNPLVKFAHGKFIAYDKPRTHTVGDTLYDTALESFGSLLLSRSVKSRSIILKKNED